MPPENLMYIMTAAIVVAAVAILIQTGLLVGMYLATKAMREQITSLAGKADPLLDSSKRLLESSQKIVDMAQVQVKDLGAKANEMVELSRKQLIRVDEVLADAVTRTRVQLDRVELVMDDTANRFQETIAILQNGIIKPVRQINALAQGLSTAFSWILRGRRTTPEQATHDEEMFI